MRVKGKPPQDDMKGVIYSIPCECDALYSYIGETGRTLKTRLTEHQPAVRNKNSNNNGPCNDYTPQFQEGRGQSNLEGTHLTSMKVKEALIIKRTANNMHHDSGFLGLDSVWCHSSLPSYSANT